MKKLSGQHRLFNPLQEIQPLFVIGSNLYKMNTR